MFNKIQNSVAFSIFTTRHYFPFKASPRIFSRLISLAPDVDNRTLPFGLSQKTHYFLVTMLLSVILIFLVLAAQFESFTDPLIILLGSVPLALSGALLFAFLDFTTLNIYSQVGLITLVGLVAKNGILIVEFANHLRDHGMDRVQAVIQASGTRLRPILMTSVATVVGHFPLILASGPGAASRNSIGIVLVTGMIIGTIFTLIVIPAIYSIMAKNSPTKSPETGSDSQRNETPQEPSSVLTPSVA